MRTISLAALLGVAALSVLAFLPTSTSWRAGDEPLWHQIEASELIVLARVTRVDEASSLMPEGTDRVAVLEVLETWKGEACPFVRVPFNDYPAWPEPPRYAPGETVVAFLRWQDGELTTVGMSQGAIPAHRRLPELRDRITRTGAMQEEQASS